MVYFSRGKYKKSFPVRIFRFPVRIWGFLLRIFSAVGIPFSPRSNVWAGLTGGVRFPTKDILFPGRDIPFPGKEVLRL